MNKDHKKFILYVEDEAVQSKIFSKIIENEVSQEKYKVISFNTGAEFIDLINSRHQKYQLSQFGVILLDLSMHDYSGLTMLAEAKKLSVTNPIAILSAREDKETKDKALELGAKEYFVKGKSFEELERLGAFIVRNMED